MRVVIFTEVYYPFISGVVTHIETLKNGLEARGHQVLIVTLNPDYDHASLQGDILYCPSIPLKKIYGYGIANPWSFERYEIIKEFHPDIIHIHTEFSLGVAGITYAKRLKIPVIYTLHTMYDDYLFYVAPNAKARIVLKSIAHRYFHQIANHATEIIGPSQKVREFLRRCGYTHKINLIPNTVDLSQFHKENVDREKTEQLREELGILPGDTTMCFVGRLGHEKSIDVLIDYFTASFKGEKQYKLFVIGKGPDYELLQKQIADNGVEEQVKLLGYIEHDDLPPYYQLFDLYATASTSEMNSIANLEAGASGLYLIQKYDEYNIDQIEIGLTGDIYHDQKEFEKLVREEGEMTSEEKEARRNAVAEKSKSYGINEFMDSVLAVYNKAIEEYQ